MINFAEYVNTLDLLENEQKMLARKIEYRKIALRRDGAEAKEIPNPCGFRATTYEDSILKRLEFEKDRVDAAIAFVRTNAELPPKESEVTKVD